MALCTQLVKYAKFEVITVVLLQIKVLWDVTLCRWVNSPPLVSKERGAFIFRLEQSKDPEYERNTILRTVGTIYPT